MPMKKPRKPRKNPKMPIKSLCKLVYFHLQFFFEFDFEFNVLRLMISLFPLLYILLCFETNCIWLWAKYSFVNMKPTTEILFL